MTKVSVIIPCYNVEKYLQQCLESILNQTLRDIEIICIEDCSTDKTKEILNTYSGNAKVKIIYNAENKGLAVSRNVGMDNAKGEYIYFLDSDDTITENCLEILYNKIKATNVDLVVGGTKAYPDDENDSSCVKYSKQMNNWLENSNLEKLKVSSNNISYFYNAISCTAWNKLYSSNFLRSNELYFINDRCFHEDNGFWLKVLSCYPTLSCISDKTYLYRIRAKSITSDIAKDNELHIQHMQKSLEDALSYSQKHHNMIFQKFIKTEIYKLNRHPLFEWIWSNDQKKLAICFISIFNFKKVYKMNKCSLKILGLTVWKRKM